MKKLYFLDEEEKNRILNLHESATKRQYLGEQPLGPVKVPEVGPKREGVTRDSNWNGIYACVKKAKGAVASTLSDKSTAYILNGYVYYNNGMKRKQPVKSNKSEKYTCNDPEFKSGVATEDKTKKIQQYRQQVITKTSDTTKQIQKFLGLPETGVMDSGLLQKINDKLNGSGTASAPAASTGTTAASTGTTAASTGTTADDTGTTAAATGTTAAATGTTAAATGTTATSATTQPELSQTSQQALSGQLTPQQIRQQSRFDQRLARQARRNERRAGNN
jgi:hypothetical protein